MLKPAATAIHLNKPMRILFLYVLVIAVTVYVILRQFASRLFPKHLTLKLVRETSLRGESTIFKQIPSSTSTPKIECTLDLNQKLEFLDPPSQKEEEMIGLHFQPYENILNYSQGHHAHKYDKYVVPNIVHLVKIKQHVVSFSEMVCIRSIYLNHRPDKIVIHCDCDRLEGKYWEYIQELPSLVIRRILPPDRVNGIKFGFTEHVTDVVRIQVLRQFGGIYLDSDVYVAKSLNPYRKYETALCTHPRNSFGNQIIIANRKSRFLYFYYASYKCYNPKFWYYNAGHFPRTAILDVRPWLIHGEERRFGCDRQMISRLFGLEPFPTMMDYTAMHIFIHHRHLAPLDTVKEFDDQNIKNYSRPFGELARLVLYGQRGVVPFNATIVPVKDLAKFLK